jgi:hypothetical protein
MRRLFTALAVLTISARAAHADSDGYYCTGPGYLAVEFRSFNTPGLSGPHVLKIVRFDAKHGPRWAGEVVLDDFQPHRLTCGPDGVMVEGWGIGFLSYDVALDTSRAPRIRARIAEPERKFAPLGATPGNLGDWARAGVVSIPAIDGPHRFQLRVSRRSRPENQGLRHEGTTELEELDGSGKVVRSLPLHRSNTFEPVH